MYKKNFKYGGLKDAILKYFSSSIYKDYLATNQGRRGIGILFLIEHLGFLLKAVTNDKEKQRKVIRVIKNLEKQEILDLQVQEGKVTVYLKNKNHPKIIEYSIKSILDFKKKNKKWEGKWFLIFFDVPEIQRNKRDYLRRFLLKMGFFQYQKSVYLFPYECEKEIILIKKIIKGARYIKYIIAEKIEDEENTKNYFNLQS